MVMINDKEEYYCNIQQWEKVKGNLVQMVTFYTFWIQGIHMELSARKSNAGLCMGSKQKKKKM